ncbi:MAG: hypothetical protein CMH52_10705 [Myxococcales bacterium]|nr:hypothetical protein [Myxococcales bacterium]
MTHLGRRIVVNVLGLVTFGMCGCDVTLRSAPDAALVTEPESTTSGTGPRGMAMGPGDAMDDTDASMSDQGIVPEALNGALRRSPDGWQLWRHGHPYHVRGAGGSYDLPALKAAGGNSIRTWGIDQNTQALLDEAHQLGLTVSLGLWLGHAEHGFDYRDSAAVAAQKEAVRQWVLQFKDHPALLVWGVGNEVELNNDIPEVWAAIEDIAAMIKEIDPDTPTMAVTAELGQDNANKIRTLTPSIDIWGLNVYEGIESISRRLTAANWDGPYLITEYGPRGAWASPLTQWGRPIEPSGLEKRVAYANAYRAIKQDARRALGGYAFIWTPPARPTDTWFSLYGLAPPVPGETQQRTVPTTMIDALVEAWTGIAPDNRGPDVMGLTIDQTRFNPGDRLEARINAIDPEGDPMTYWWVLVRDELGLGIDWHTRALCEPVGNRSDTLSINVPQQPGHWRLFGFAEGTQGRISHGSHPFLVLGEATQQAPLPLSALDQFVPTGWMGDTDQLSLEDCPTAGDFCGGVCMGIRWQPPEAGGWFGIRWQHPGGNWGDEPGLTIQAGTTEVTFVAWSDKAGTTASFAVGSNRETFRAESGLIELSDTPQTYRIELNDQRATEVKTGFEILLDASEGDDIGQVFLKNVLWTR